MTSFELLSFHFKCQGLHYRVISSLNRLPKQIDLPRVLFEPMRFDGDTCDDPYTRSEHSRFSGGGNVTQT